MKVKQMALEALKQVAQALAWSEHGECRGYHDKLPAAGFALEFAKTAIAALEADMAQAVHNMPAYPVGPCDCSLSTAAPELTPISDAEVGRAVNTFKADCSFRNLADMRKALEEFLQKRSAT